MKDFNEFLSRCKTKRDRKKVYEELKQNKSVSFHTFLLRFCEERGVGTRPTRKRVPYFKVYVEQVNSNTPKLQLIKLLKDNSFGNLRECRDAVVQKDSFVLCTAGRLNKITMSAKEMGVSIRYEEM